MTGEAAGIAELGNALVVVRGIPAEVCDQCGEPYADAETTRRIEGIVERARQAGGVVIRQYEQSAA